MRRYFHKWRHITAPRLYHPVSFSFFSCAFFPFQKPNCPKATKRAPLMPTKNQCLPRLFPQNVWHIIWMDMVSSVTFICTMNSQYRFYEPIWFVMLEARKFRRAKHLGLCNTAWKIEDYLWMANLTLKMTMRYYSAIVEDTFIAPPATEHHLRFTIPPRW